VLFIQTAVGGTCEFLTWSTGRNIVVNRGKLCTETSDLGVQNLMRFCAVHFVIYQLILEISY
jgi:hypothetical protein